MKTRKGQAGKAGGLRLKTQLNLQGSKTTPLRGGRRIPAKDKMR